MPPLTSQPFGAEWRVLKICESHSLTSPFLTRSTRVLWGIESPITQPTFTYNAPLSTFGLLPGLGTKVTCEPKTHFAWENKRKVRPTNAAGFCQARFFFFFWKKTRAWGAAGPITFQFTVTLDLRRILCGIHNDSPRLVGGCILTRNRDWGWKPLGDS